MIYGLPQLGGGASICAAPSPHENKNKIIFSRYGRFFLHIGSLFSLWGTFLCLPPLQKVCGAHATIDN